MIHAEDLRIGNRIFWKPDFADVLIQVEITSVMQDRVGYIRSHLEHRVEPFEDDVVTQKMPLALFSELQPIPLLENYKKKIPGKIKFPSWIKFVHELQNWYYWSNGKKELELAD